MPTPTRDPRRARDLRLIHAAKRQMAWDETTYRAILERMTGKSSAADLNAKERQAVLDDFARLGWKPQKVKGHRNPNANAKTADPDLALTGAGWGKDRLISKIGALLVNAKPPRSWAYADGIARQMFKIESVRFCDAEQLRRIVAALTYDARRRARQTSQEEPSPCA